MAAIDQINVTPLLDLTFLLLIAFMITMPLMEYGTNVKPPAMNSDTLPDENVINLVLTKSGTFMIGQEAVDRDELIRRLEILSSQNPKPQLLIRGDGERSYNEVIELLSIARNAGFSDATLVTQAEDKK
jgi:biopolymer transport protein ExbD